MLFFRFLKNKKLAVYSHWLLSACMFIYLSRMEVTLEIRRVPSSAHILKPLDSAAAETQGERETAEIFFRLGESSNPLKHARFG